MSLLPDAIDAFQKTLAIRDKDAKAVYGLGRALLGMAKFQDAQEQFRCYVELRPDDAAGHYALGMSLVALQQLEDARKEFDKSIALTPLQTESYFRLGLLDLDSKNLDAAAKNFNHVLERDPKHAGALAALGRVRFEQKAYADAVDFLQRAVASNDGLREAHYYLGLTYARMGRKQESAEQLQIATRLEHEETEKQRTMLRILDPGDGTDSTQ
jgi:tetratricopeptide (TPR) repeat protein